MVGRSLFYGATDNMLHKRSFDGVSSGPPSAINPYSTRCGARVVTGSGAAGSTYAGVRADLVHQTSTGTAGGIREMTGMFYWNGRLYYTLAGINSLFWRFFMPDSGIVNPIREHRDRREHQLDVRPRGCSSTATTSTPCPPSTDHCRGSPSSTERPAGPRRSSTARRQAASTGAASALFLASVLPNVGPSAELHRDLRRDPLHVHLDLEDCDGRSPRTTGTSATARVRASPRPTTSWPAAPTRLPDRRGRRRTPSPRRPSRSRS